MNKFPFCFFGILYLFFQTVLAGSFPANHLAPASRSRLNEKELADLSRPWTHLSKKDEKIALQRAENILASRYKPNFQTPKISLRDKEFPVFMRALILLAERQEGSLAIHVFSEMNFIMNGESPDPLLLSAIKDIAFSCSKQIEHTLHDFPSFGFEKYLVNKKGHLNEEVFSVLKEIALKYARTNGFRTLEYLSMFGFDRIIRESGNGKIRPQVLDAIKEIALTSIIQDRHKQAINKDDDEMIGRFYYTRLSGMLYDPKTRKLDKNVLAAIREIALAYAATNGEATARALEQFGLIEKRGDRIQPVEPEIQSVIGEILDACAVENGYGTYSSLEISSSLGIPGIKNKAFYVETSLGKGEKDFLNPFSDYRDDLLNRLCSGLYRYNQHHTDLHDLYMRIEDLSREEMKWLLMVKQSALEEEYSNPLTAVMTGLEILEENSWDHHENNLEILLNQDIFYTDKFRNVRNLIFDERVNINDRLDFVAYLRGIIPITAFAQDLQTDHSLDVMFSDSIPACMRDVELKFKGEPLRLPDTLNQAKRALMRRFILWLIDNKKGKLSFYEETVLSDGHIYPKIETMIQIVMGMNPKYIPDFEIRKIREYVKNYLIHFFKALRKEEKSGVDYSPAVMAARNESQRFLMAIGENRKEIKRLVKAGYSSRLFTEGLALEVPLKRDLKGEERRKRERIAAATQEIVADILHNELKIGRINRKNLTPKYAQSLDTYEKIASFVVEAEKVLDKRRIPLPPRINQILREIKRLEKVKASAEVTFTVKIKKDLFDESSAGYGVPGCYNPNGGIHQEAPLIRGLEANVFFIQVYDETGKQVANAECVATQYGIFTYPLHSSTPYDCEILMGKIILEMLKLRWIPAAMLAEYHPLPENPDYLEKSAGYSLMTKYGEKLSGTYEFKKKHLLSTHAQYFDFGKVDYQALSIHLSDPFRITFQSALKNGAFTMEEATKAIQRTTSDSVKEEMTEINWQKMADILLGNNQAYLKAFPFLNKSPSVFFRVIGLLKAEGVTPGTDFLMDNEMAGKIQKMTGNVPFQKEFLELIIQFLNDQKVRVLDERTSPSEDNNQGQGETETRNNLLACA